MKLDELEAIRFLDEQLEPRQCWDGLLEQSRNRNVLLNQRFSSWTQQRIRSQANPYRWCCWYTGSWSQVLFCSAEVPTDLSRYTHSRIEPTSAGLSHLVGIMFGIWTDNCFQPVHTGLGPVLPRWGPLMANTRNSDIRFRPARWLPFVESRGKGGSRTVSLCSPSLRSGRRMAHK